MIYQTHIYINLAYVNYILFVPLSKCAGAFEPVSTCTFTWHKDQGGYYLTNQDL